jgi:hypothetical protein
MTKISNGMTMSIIDTSSNPPRVVSGDELERARVQRIIDTRHDVAEAHCKANGWPTNPSILSIAQIMEIRALPEWQNAGKP